MNFNIMFLATGFLYPSGVMGPQTLTGLSLLQAASQFWLVMGQMTLLSGGKGPDGNRGPRFDFCS